MTYSLYVSRAMTAFCVYSENVESARHFNNIGYNYWYTYDDKEHFQYDF